MKTSGSVLVAIAVLFVLVGWSLYLSLTRTPAITESDLAQPNRPSEIDRVRNEQERARMKAYVKKLQSNKKVIKSFAGPSGDTIDCVDVYNQPALRRPGMEKHELQFVPAMVPTASEEEKSTKENEVLPPQQLFSLIGDTCPEKSVPMRRLTMETLKRFETLDDFFKKRPPFGNNTSAPHEYAHARRTVDNFGAESILNGWSPSVEENDEFSLSQIWVVGGAGADRDTVEAGWQVYDDLYGDGRARLFIYFTPDNYGDGGCYNLDCDGFVQVANSVYLGGDWDSYSSPGGIQREIKLRLHKDGSNGDWWFRYNDTWVGYWPRSLFNASGLEVLADRIDFGGEIVNTSPDGRHTATDMGSGYFPNTGYGYAAYQRSLRYIEPHGDYGTWRNATGLTERRTDSDCYDVELHSASNWGEYFYFGGMGYNGLCP